MVKVDKPTVDFKDDGIYVHFTITEGDRFTIGTSEFKGDLIYPPNELAEQGKNICPVRFSTAAP